jgi:hypothetical protein
MVEGLVRIGTLGWVKGQQFVQHVKSPLIFDVTVKPLLDFSLLALGQFNLGEKFQFLHSRPHFRNHGTTQLTDESKLEKTHTKKEEMNKMLVE